jgi:hypothetical protein
MTLKELSFVKICKRSIICTNQYQTNVSRHKLLYFQRTIANINKLFFSKSLDGSLSVQICDTGGLNYAFNRSMDGGSVYLQIKPHKYRIYLIHVYYITRLCTIQI